MRLVVADAVAQRLASGVQLYAEARLGVYGVKKKVYRRYVNFWGFGVSLLTFPRAKVYNISTILEAV